MDLKIHHVGYLVKNIKRATTAFSDLGFVATSDLIDDDYRKIQILFMEKDGYTIELVCPTDKTTKIADLARRVGNSPYHICYICHNLEETEQSLKEAGYVLCDEAHEAVAFDNRRVCFYIHPFLGMIELLEE